MRGQNKVIFHTKKMEVVASLNVVINCLLFLQSLVSLVNGFQEKLSGLEEQAAQLELVGSDASKATISRSMTTVWQRWTRLRSVARGRERVLEDTAQEWRTFSEKVHRHTNVYFIMMNDNIVIYVLIIYCILAAEFS